MRRSFFALGGRPIRVFSDRVNAADRVPAIKNAVFDGHCAESVFTVFSIRGGPLTRHVIGLLVASTVERCVPAIELGVALNTGRPDFLELQIEMEEKWLLIRLRRAVGMGSVSVNNPQELAANARNLGLRS